MAGGVPLFRDQCEQMGSGAWKVIETEHPLFGRYVCGAKKRRGQPMGGRHPFLTPRVRVCPRSPMWNSKCREHGGANMGRPMTNPSKSPAAKRFFKALEEAEQDPGLLDMRRVVVRLEAAVQVLMDALRDRDSPEFRQQALDLYRKGDMDALGELLERGAAESETLRELVRVVDILGKQVHKIFDAKSKASVAIHIRDLKSFVAEIAQIQFDVLDTPDLRPYLDKITKRIDLLTRIGGVRDWEAIEG